MTVTGDTVAGDAEGLRKGASSASLLSLAVVTPSELLSSCPSLSPVTYALPSPGGASNISAICKQIANWLRLAQFRNH